MNEAVMVLSAAGSDHMPLYVPVVLTACAVAFWFAGFRRMLRDPRAEFRRIAEARARSRILHPFGGGDVEVEFARQWRLRWLVPVVAIAYCAGVIWFYVLAFTT